jgi:eukaryotic-like serine/threonine-protein kinase
MAGRDDTKRIGPYQVRRLLGRGATASVYECRHATLGRLAAVKVLHPHLARDEVAAARFLREGRALSTMIHPNIVEVFDVGEHEGAPYLVMTLIDGEDLRDHVRRLHPLSMADVADCMMPVISGVATAHDAGIIHRDLKPSNIRLTRDHRGVPVPKVLDFGISKWTEDEQTADLTDTDGALGTASYMAPEQLRSAKHVDARCDVYALGVILYECATGVRPFRGARGYDLMHAVLTEPVAPPSFWRPGISASFDTVVLRAMQREPSDRFASARDLGRALAALSSDPAGWLVEFSNDPKRAPAVPRATMESSDPSNTLISRSRARNKMRPGRLTVAVASCAACVALVAVGILLIGRASAQSSPHPPPGARIGARASMASSAGDVATSGPESFAPAQSPPSVMTAASAPRIRSRAPHPVLVKSAGLTPIAPAKEEMGRNGAPILE